MIKDFLSNLNDVENAALLVVDETDVELSNYPFFADASEPLQLAITRTVEMDPEAMEILSPIFDKLNKDKERPSDDIIANNLRELNSGDLRYLDTAEAIELLKSIDECALKLNPIYQSLRS